MDFEMQICLSSVEGRSSGSRAAAPFLKVRFFAGQIEFFTQVFIHIRTYSP